MKSLPVWICVGLLAAANLQLMSIRQSVKLAEPVNNATLEEAQRRGDDALANEINRRPRICVEIER